MGALQQGQWLSAAPAATGSGCAGLQPPANAVGECMGECMGECSTFAGLSSVLQSLCNLPLDCLSCRGVGTDLLMHGVLWEVCVQGNPVAVRQFSAWL